MIPKIIHQIWLGADEPGTKPEPPPHFAAASASWREMNPGWEVRHWSGGEIDRLFASVRPDLLALYRSYPDWVQRVDAAKYLLMHEFGGVYVDFDIICTRSIEPFAGEELVVAPTRPAGLATDLMMARAGHPFFKAVLDEMPRSYRMWQRRWFPRHLRIMRGTGPLLATHVFRRFRKLPEVRLLTEPEYGHGDSEHAYVRHIPGNTWTRWDSHAFIFIGEHWKKFAVGAGAAAAAAICAATLVVGR